MSETPSGSATPKGIGSLAKKQSDVTRQGTQKLKFTPTLPARRKKDEVKAEPIARTIPESSNAATRGRGRGRGNQDGGRGRGRGASPPVEMTASGPFAMGPALAGGQVRRSASRADFTPAVPTSSAASAALGENLTRTAAPTLKGLDPKGKGKVKEEEEEEIYSDPEEGVEIIDMNQIKDMDWMAPESLREEKRSEKVKDSDVVDARNALDLSESEDEEELEDLIEDFTIKNDLDADSTLSEDRLYFFQFPAPFPKFTKQSVDPYSVGSVEPAIEPPQAESSTKRVSFAPDTKSSTTPASSHPSTTPPELVKEEPVDGIIGQLEVYRSGAVKIRLANGILFDVNAATQPSFLQQAAHLDLNAKRLVVLGEVNKQFVVSPDVDSLLEGMERKDTSSTFEGEEDLIKMDVT